MSEPSASTAASSSSAAAAIVAPVRPPPVSIAAQSSGSSSSLSTGTPRTPRRESKDVNASGGIMNGVSPMASMGSRRASVRVHRLSKSNIKPMTEPSKPSTNAPTATSNAAGATTAGASAGTNEHHSSTRSGEKVNKPAVRSKRWGAIRKEVIPNPAMMQVSEKVQHIIHTLRTPPEDRSENDVKLLYMWLMNQEKLSSLFTTMSEVSAKKLCKEMEFLHLRAGEVVVNQGDKGNTCFILVSGLVSVYVRNAEEQKKYQRSIRSAMELSGSRRMSDVMGQINFGAKVATLTPGATFGELCLIEPDSKRSATVVVDPQAESANFIILTAASYLRMTRSQTIEGTITDHIAFLQHMLIFRKWSKMQLMHLVNSMKLVTVPAGQYIAHKGAEAEAFFIFLRGEAQECVKLMVNENNEMSMGENRGVQHCITVELTYLGKFDVAGEYLAAEKKVVSCPVDIRAVTDVDCLLLNRKLFQLHFGGKDIKKHAQRALKKIRSIAEARENWRETRINQAMLYPNLRVPITRKLMRLSGNCCVICGRNTHVAGDELCMELALYNMEDEKKKKRGKKQETRSSRHRISFSIHHHSHHHHQRGSHAANAAAAIASNPSKHQKQQRDELPTLEEDDDEDESDESDEEAHRETRARRRLGSRLVARQWKEAAKAGLHPHHAHMPRPPDDINKRNSSVRPVMPMLPVRPASVMKKRSIHEEIQHIRQCWPYQWQEITQEPDHHHDDAQEKEETKSRSARSMTSYSRSPSKDQRRASAMAILSALGLERKSLTTR